MQYNAVIFDMDGVLINSEPLWQIAGKETLLQFGKELTSEQYRSSTGLRTKEWIEHWFHHFNIDMAQAPLAVNTIVQKAIALIYEKGQVFDGISYIMDFFKQRNLLIGLATSSPLSLVKVVLEKLQLQNAFDAIASAEHLPYGKPHPQVYMNCAATLQVQPLHCIAIEDSFNGMIAAKAARMKCVVIPATEEYEHTKWNAADMKIKSLKDFDEKILNTL